MKYIGGPYHGQTVPDQHMGAMTIDVPALGTAGKMTYRRQGWQMANGRTVHVMVLDSMLEVEAATLAQAILGD